MKTKNNIKHKKSKMNVNKIRVNFIFIFGVLILFLVFCLRISYLCLYDYKVLDSTITSFIKKRNTNEEIIMPSRGSIYDSNGNVLAEDVVSYSVIAYLSPTRSENSKVPLHVVDPSITAQTLAPYINMDVKLLENILRKDAYQVELGPGSRNLTQLQMEEIKNLNLPGIDFVESTKRYYPNGDFASYSVGYTINKEDDNKNVWKVGQLGIEEYYNELLTGKSGYVRYEKDRYGYKIFNGREYVEKAVNGSDIYLTIDDNIQLFAENALSKMITDSSGEWGFITVVNAKTGAIYAYASNPSFNPNERNITNYIDLLTGTAYEPGSTMKIFSYMCAIDNGKYNGDDVYNSGSISYNTRNGQSIVIHDWNKTGWGTISYDYGFAMSSNVGAASLLETDVINKKVLSSCYEKYGFGKKTGYTVNREVGGNLNITYDVDAASATFGQAMTITPIQMIQALTSISNDGKMLKPYIVSKIVDSNTGEVTYKANVSVIDTIANSSTVNKIKSLMDSVVCNDSSMCTGSAYYMDDYKIIGKTGTAQIYDEKTGTYMTGASDYVYSFAGMYPMDDPNIIIYVGLKKPKDTTNYVAPAVKDVVINTSKYLNLVDDKNDYSSYKISLYVNKKTDVVKTELKKNDLNVIVLGDGDVVINQYPSKGSVLQNGSKVVLLTDNYTKVMPNLVGFSYKDAFNILKLMGVKHSLNGNGYVVNQSIPEGQVVNDNDEVVINFESNIE